MAAKTFATYLSELTEATALGTGDRVPVLESSTVKYVDGAELTPYLKYVALLSQSGTSAPTATVLENTLGGTVVWTRNDVGDYTGTLAGAFSPNKTAILIGNNSGQNAQVAVFRNNTSTVSCVSSSSDFSLADDILSHTIEIRVYP
jgi:hypothetical protein